MAPELPVALGQGAHISWVRVACGLPAEQLCIVMVENRNERAGESCVITWGWRMQKNLLMSSPSLPPLSLHPFIFKTELMKR